MGASATVAAWVCLRMDACADASCLRALVHTRTGGAAWSGTLWGWTSAAAMATAMAVAMAAVAAVAVATAVRAKARADPHKNLPARLAHK